jgi:P27 family predicted phage terminase small subunit
MGESLAAWSMLAPLLRKLRAQDGLPLLTAGSRHALAMYCVAWADWLEAVKTIAEKGSILTADKSGYQYPHPAVGMKKTAAVTIRQLGQEFGLTPANRVAMGVTAGEKDALDAFLGAGK